MSELTTKVLFWITHYLFTIKAINGNSGVLLEYCNHETFNPTCPNGQVIIMETAYYGRMRLGRCLDESFGYMGCSVNVLSQMDQQCSGKRSCEVLIVTIQEQLNCTVPRTLTRYLEAQYTCRQVMPVTEGKCDIDLKSRRHSITNTDISASGCGTDTTPYILKSKPGQKINVTLVDFNWNDKHENLKGCLQRYGYFVDVDEVYNICGKTKRIKHLLLSGGDPLHLVVDKNTGEISFILSFEVIGCPTFESPPDTWTKEDNDVVTIGCVHNDNNWKMRCIGNHWIGILGKCEKGTNKQDLNQQKAPQVSDTIFGLPSVVGFSLIGCIFLVILCVMVTTIIAYFCIRKPKGDRKEYYLSPVPTSYCPTLPLQTIQSYRNVNTGNFNTDSNQTTVSHHRTLSTSGVEHNELIQNSISPQYFVLENREELKEPIYDAVYQNIGDVNSA